jgi:hypothetical protein
LWANATYTFTSFEGGGNNSGGTTVNGINNNQIVGFSTDLNANVTNWIRNTNGSFTILNLPVGSLANGINITSTVVGQNGSLAFVFSGGIYSILPNVNGTTTSEFAFGVNDKETIVGQYADSNTGTTSGLVYRSGAFTTLNPVVNALVTNAPGINNT